jgi:hypothetical protein
MSGVFERLFVVRAGSSPEGEAKAVKSARGMALHQLQSLVGKHVRVCATTPMRHACTD